jgi:hypothetical protein
VSKFQHHTKLCSKCGILLVSNTNMCKLKLYTGMHNAISELLIQNSPCLHHAGCQYLTEGVCEAIYTHIYVYISSSSLGATALRRSWLPVLFASTSLYPELSFSILQSPSLVGPLERHLAIRVYIYIIYVHGYLILYIYI